MRRRKATVELFEESRRDYEFGIGTIQGSVRKFGVHRRQVREVMNDAQPTQKPAPPREVLSLVEGASRNGIATSGGVELEPTRSRE
jgi:hypothetical protein